MNIYAFAAALFLFAGVVNANEHQTSTHQHQIQVFKSETCGCCQHWIDHLTDQGMSVQSHNSEQMGAVKHYLGIAPQYHSCHSGVINNQYVFEGHVPAKFIRQFLQAPPAGALGLAVPRMPIGSPGMEMGERFQPYQVLLLLKDGSSAVYADIKSYKEQF